MQRRNTKKERERREGVTVLRGWRNREIETGRKC